MQEADRKSRRPLVLDAAGVEALDAERGIAGAARIGHHETRGADGAGDAEPQLRVLERRHDARVDVGDAGERAGQARIAIRELHRQARGADGEVGAQRARDGAAHVEPAAARQPSGEGHAAGTA